MDIVAAKKSAVVDARLLPGKVALYLLVGACGCGAWTAMAAEAVSWDFESGNGEWQARGESVTVQRALIAGPSGKQTPSLRIHGRIEDGWNYAVSNRVPMTAGKLYCLSAWVRVQRAGPGTPMPYLKCEFQSADRNREIGRANTDTYDAAPLGKWQRLRGEFRAPKGTQKAWLALEKGTDAPTEIDACLADVRLEQIERFGFWDTYRLKPIPPALEKVRGVHPRIYLTSQRVAELHAAIKTTHAAIWRIARAAIGTGQIICCATWPGDFKTATPNGWPNRSTTRTSLPQRPLG